MSFAFHVSNRYLTLQSKTINERAFMNYRNIITIEAEKRGGKPCIRGMRITVYDVLSWLASGMSTETIMKDFPELTQEDIQAALSFASEREHHAIYAHHE